MLVELARYRHPSGSTRESFWVTGGDAGAGGKVVVGIVRGVVDLSVERGACACA